MSESVEAVRRQRIRAYTTKEQSVRSLWGILLVFVIAAQTVGAPPKDPNAAGHHAVDPNYPADPNKLLRMKWDAVISILRNKKLDQKEKAKRIDKVVSPIFDFPLMAKLALGRKHWPQLTAAQQKKFTGLFVKRLKISYRQKISLYKDEKVHFKPAVKKGKIICYIPIELISKDEKITIVHKLRKGSDKRWKVFDVEIQGVSILLTYRSQFDDILQKGTVEDLLAQMEKPPAS
jgi:phospholipid transport system substrate-binding protein